MLQPWEQSAIENGYKFIIAIGQDRGSEFEIIAVSKNIASSERIAEEYTVNTGCIVICDIKTQRLVSVLQC